MSWHIHKYGSFGISDQRAASCVLKEKRKINIMTEGVKNDNGNIWQEVKSNNEWMPKIIEKYN